MVEDKLNNISNIDFSKLHFYSIGLVKKDVDLDTGIIEVYLLEKTPELTDEITKDPKPIPNVTVPTEKGTETYNLELKNTVKAKWISINQYNRISPPTIRKGEYVIVYRIANSDLYFWDTVMNDVRWRKEEQIIYAVSDKDKVDPNENIENMYYLYINTFNKFIKAHTTDKYNEYTTYDFKIDTLNGEWKLKDGNNNYIKWCSNVNYDPERLHIHTDTNDGEYTTYDMSLNVQLGNWKLKDGNNNYIYWNSNTNKDPIRFHIHTDINDSEITTYDIELNVQEGYFTIYDGKGNVIRLDSSADTLSINTNVATNINSTASVTVTSANINILGGVMTNIVCAGPVNIKGSVVNIN